MSEREDEHAEDCVCNLCDYWRAVREADGERPPYLNGDPS